MIAADCSSCEGGSHHNPQAQACLSCCVDCGKWVCDACVYYIDGKELCPDCEDARSEAASEREFDDGSAPCESDR